MSLNQLEKIDNYRFYLRCDRGSELCLSSAPLFTKASGTSFEMSMLRDIDLSILYKVGETINLGLYAVYAHEDESHKKSLHKLFEYLRKNNDMESNGDVVGVYFWSHRFTRSSIVSSNRRWIDIDGFKVSWWINQSKNKKKWVLSNPEIKIGTNRLVQAIC